MATGERFHFVRWSFLLCFYTTGCFAESTVKSQPIKIWKIENGDVVDCIDIYSQPAFDHPLLKNHSLMKQPSSFPIRKSDVTSSSETAQSLVEGKEYCPEGSIPILRATRRSRRLVDDHYAPPPGSGKTGLLRAFLEEEGHFHGATGALTVWTPGVSFFPEFSAVKMTVISCMDDVELKRDKFNSIQAGWIVNKKLYGDYRPRIFIYWTRDGFVSTGCYNLLCPGFVQVSRVAYLGAELTPVSIYGGESRALPVEIFKDSAQIWWLALNGKHIGYWPREIFTSLSDAATRIQWGAEVYNVMPHGVPTITEMGNGHFPWEGLYRSCSIHALQVINTEDEYVDPVDAINYADRPACYDSNPMEKIESLGCYTLVGGPGPGHFLPGCT